MKRIIAGLGLVLLSASYGVDWFPAPRPGFTNNSTAFRNTSSAAKAVDGFGIYSTPGR